MLKAHQQATGPKTAQGKAATAQNLAGHPTPEEALCELGDLRFGGGLLQAWQVSLGVLYRTRCWPSAKPPSPGVSRGWRTLPELDAADRNALTLLWRRALGALTSHLARQHPARHDDARIDRERLDAELQRARERLSRL